jgi:hypothetical protein
MDVEIRAPHQLKQRPIIRLGYPQRDAGRIREAHFPGIDRRMLRLLGVGTLQQITG